MAAWVSALSWGLFYGSSLFLAIDPDIPLRHGFIPVAVVGSALVFSGLRHPAGRQRHLRWAAIGFIAFCIGWLASLGIAFGGLAPAVRFLNDYLANSHILLTMPFVYLLLCMPMAQAAVTVAATFAPAEPALTERERLVLGSRCALVLFGLCFFSATWHLAAPAFTFVLFGLFYSSAEIFSQYPNYPERMIAGAVCLGISLPALAVAAVLQGKSSRMP